MNKWQTITEMEITQGENSFGTSRYLSSADARAKNQSTCWSHIAQSSSSTLQTTKDYSEASTNNSSPNWPTGAQYQSRMLAAAAASMI